MRPPSRPLVLLVIFAAVATARVGEQLYRWAAFAEERAQLAGLRTRLVDAGAEMVRSALDADSLHAVVERHDAALEASRRTMERYERFAAGGAIPVHLYDAYRDDLATHNRRVAERNQEAGRWKERADRNRAATARYNLLADTVRIVAGRMGDPHYPVPLPAEAALERGVLPPRPGVSAWSSNR